MIEYSATTSDREMIASPGSYHLDWAEDFYSALILKLQALSDAASIVQQNVVQGTNFLSICLTLLTAYFIVLSFFLADKEREIKSGATPYRHKSAVSGGIERSGRCFDLRKWVARFDKRQGLVQGSGDAV